LLSHQIFVFVGVVAQQV